MGQVVRSVSIDETVSRQIEAIQTLENRPSFSNAVETLLREAIAAHVSRVVQPAEEGRTA